MKFTRKWFLLILLLPLWVSFAAVFALCELLDLLLCAWWRPLLRRSRIPASCPREPKASVVILNWNGRSLLEECLPSVVAEVERTPGDHEVIVIDNGSTDDSVAMLQETFPSVRIVRHKQNYFFSKGYNRGVQSARGDLLVFLNNDMMVEPGFLAALIEPFRDDPDLFAVTAQVFFADASKRREETGKTRALWRKGWIEYAHHAVTEGDTRNGLVPVFYAGGGSAAVDRVKFTEIGGFDVLLDPFYVEDTDLSYQAWKRGWKVLLCPASKVIHKHRSSSGRIDRRHLERIIRRNQLLFIWKNITDWRPFFAHLWFLPRTLERMGHALGATQMARIFLMALARWPHAWTRRFLCRFHYQFTDREVFRVANHTFEYKQRWLPLPPIRSTERLRILFVCPYLPTPLHAGGGRMLQLIRRLALEHDVSVLSFTDNEEERRFLPELKSVCRRLVAIERYPHRQGKHVFWPLPWTMEVDFSDPQFHERLCEMLGDDEYDVIQCEYIQLAAQIPRLRREVTVLTEHEVQHAATWRRFQGAKNVGARLDELRRWFLWFDAEMRFGRRFDRIVTLTDADAWSLQRFDPSLRVDVVPTCVDLEYFSPNGYQETPASLVYVGAFRHSPNVDAALFLVEEILPKVRQRFPEVRVCLAGSNPPPEMLRLASETVTITGWVDDLRPYIERASVFVAPIRLGVGIRGKVLEAWAMSKAVVASPIACAGIGAREGENALIAEDAEQFAVAIARLLGDASLRKRLGENGRRWVEKEFDWSVAVRRQVAVYHDCLRKKGRLIEAGPR